MELTSAPAARIYNLFPLLLGPLETWHDHLPRIARMGFDWIFVNPFHEPGASGSLYSVKDYYALHPVLTEGSNASADELLNGFTDAAHELGISVMMDLVVNHTARDSPLVDAHPAWYVRDQAGHVQAPYAVDPDDPERITVWEDLAELDYHPRSARDEMLEYWHALVSHYASLGFRGFRCDAAYKIPGDVWGELIGRARAGTPGLTFFAETLGARLEEMSQLAPAGFDYFFNSAKWWDFQAHWLLDQYEQFRHLAPSVAFPESHDTDRLAAQSRGDERESRFWYLFTACFSSGVMMPVGYELGFQRALHVVETRPDDWEIPSFDISDFVRAVNDMKAHAPVLNEEGPQRRFTADGEPLVGLLRESEHQPQRAAIVINPDRRQAHELARTDLTAALEASATAIREVTPEHVDPAGDDESCIRVGPRSVRVFLSR